MKSSKTDNKKKSKNHDINNGNEVMVVMRFSAESDCNSGTMVQQFSCGLKIIRLEHILLNVELQKSVLFG